MFLDLLKFFFGSIVGCLMLLGVSDIVDTINRPNQFIITNFAESGFEPNGFDSGLIEGRDKVCEENRQCNVLAEAIFFEARGEPIKGQYAVAYSIINRRDHWRWSDTVSGVVNQRIRGTCQFSYVCQISHPQMMKMIANDRDSWVEALEIAYDVYHFEVPDLTEGADHFYNPRKVSRTPHFAKVYEYVATIGNHKFYRSE